MPEIQLTYAKHVCSLLRLSQREVKEKRQEKWGWEENGKGNIITVTLSYLPSALYE